MLWLVTVAQMADIVLAAEWQALGIELRKDAALSTFMQRKLPTQLKPF
jgi:hypothetical protein